MTMPTEKRALASILMTVMAVLAAAGDPAGAQQSGGGIPTRILIVNGDGAGEGFNDPTPAEPVGGNPGTTLGEQRLLVFEAAADVWEGILVSTVPIEVAARFDPLFCEAEQATVGQAGPNGAFIDFPGAATAGTLYVSAQANQQAGVDLDPAEADISATFNSAIGSRPDCLGGIPFYLGIDGEPAPNRTISLFDTVLHELAHGLGFLSLVNPQTGAKLAGFDDIFSRNLEDQSRGLPWPLLDDGERAASATNTGNLQWTGETVRLCAGLVFDEGAAADGDALMFAPETLTPGSSVSHFDTSFLPDELMEPQVTPTNILDLSVAAFVDMGWPVSEQARERFCQAAVHRMARRG